MKHLLVVASLMLVLPVAALGADNAAPVPATPFPPGHPPIAAPQETPPITGKVLETMESGGYTYVYLQQKKGRKIWVAFPKAKVSVGKKVSLVPGEEFKNFKIKTLHRTFDRIIFSLGPVPKKGENGKPQQMSMPGSKEAMVPPENIKIDKASGANAFTVADLFARKGKLNGKKVVVKGKVVKVSQGIMKRNWIHLQDGTGSADKKNHDLVVTMTALPADGQIITITGTLLKDKDFGMGYKYDVLIDSAEIVK
ncbi:MAG TPA: DNA-binding protein [Geobacteraceae bacterium]|nr:DNA-binding protein [Geobacteraceae bacterium]